MYLTTMMLFDQTLSQNIDITYGNKNNTPRTNSLCPMGEER